MDKEVLGTEDSILAAAIRIFTREGFDGARMQAIADEAGINKALLHYYFRSKEKLFQKVFELSFLQMQPKMEMQISECKSIYEILCNMVDLYMDFLKKNPYLPGLIISTINHNPEFLKSIPRNVPIALFKKIELAIQNKEINKVDVAQIMTSIVSLCIAPYAAKKMMMHMSGLNEKEYEVLLNNKKSFIKKIIKSMLE